jgi:hypothetical protein
MDSRTSSAQVVATEGKGERASSWCLFLKMLPPGARALAWVLFPVRSGFFSEDLRVFHRLVGGPDPEQVAWVRGYLSHPRYRRSSLLRRMGVRGRVRLLDQWVRLHVAGTASNEGTHKT